MALEMAMYRAYHRWMDAASAASIGVGWAESFSIDRERLLEELPGAGEIPPPARKVTYFEPVAPRLARNTTPRPRSKSAAASTARVSI